MAALADWRIGYHRDEAKRLRERAEILRGEVLRLEREAEAADASARTLEQGRRA